MIIIKIKKIEGFKGYFIATNGKVYCNLGQGNRNRDKVIDMYEIKPRFTRNGYTRIYARNNLTNKRVDLYIHRLVAKYFIPNPKNKKYVNHINCNRADNRIENLEWVTAKENTDYTMNIDHIKRETNGTYKSNFIYKF